MTKFDVVSDLHFDHFVGSGDAGTEFLESVFLKPTAPNLLVAGDIGNWYSEHALPYVKRAWITEIDADFEGDTTFDALDENEWKLVWIEEHPKTEDRPFGFKFQCFERVK